MHIFILNNIDREVLVVFHESTGLPSVGRDIYLDITINRVVSVCIHVCLSLDFLYRSSDRLPTRRA